MRGFQNHKRRAGNVLVLTALMMTLMFAFLAFAVDLGYLTVARTELQRSADAASIAATWDLLNEDALRQEVDPTALVYAARATASQYANANTIINAGPALAQSDVTIGYMANPACRTSSIDTSGLYPPNAVEVRIRRTAEQNGVIPFFFARLMGFTGQAAESKATAAFVSGFSGFQASSSGQNCNLLPFALDLDTWTDLLAGVGTDNWRWDEGSKTVVAGTDDILECNLYPQGTGSPGNRGTVDIGSANNSTCDLSRQIVHGISPQDLEYMGGKIEFNSCGKLYLNGDTGISAGVKDELASIRGQTRIIPIFESVTGNGNNAQYTIVRFVGVRILDVKLTGSMSSKRLIIQPAIVKAIGGIPSAAARSDFVHTPVWLVR